MSILKAKLALNKWGNLWPRFPRTASLVFRSDGMGEANWRRLLAFNPTNTFILDDSRKIGELSTFLHDNQDKLCCGFLSYDLGLLLHNIQSRHSMHYPLAVFHAYESWLEIGQDEIQIVSRDPQYRKQIEDSLTKPVRSTAYNHSIRFTPTVQKDQYERNIDVIHDYIRAGDFYQINYTQQLEAETHEPSRKLYSELIQRHPAAHAAYFEYDDLAIHSLSPELFLYYDAGTLTTEPIKGTRPRGRSAAEDKALKNQLLNSEKEQAELYMITDLLRNDLGKVCEIGSVTLETVKQLKKLPKVWHTSSLISGKLLCGQQPIDALLSMFPGGSITGCPKRRALEVIDELESSSRGIYTGCIGYFHPDGDFSFNIAIRTLIQRGQKLSLGTGGGITIDSNWQDEWEELLVKASTFE